jgi:hypothetical protein
MGAVPAAARGRGRERSALERSAQLVEGGAHSGFTRGQRRLPVIFSSSARMPSISASGRGGTAGHVDIDRKQLVDALDHRVLAGKDEGPAGDGAVAHGDDPLGLGHLVVEGLDRRGHLLVDRAGDDHDVGLARRGTEDLGAETGDVEAGRAGGHHLDGAAGEAEGQRPQRVGPAEREQLVQFGEPDDRGALGWDAGCRGSRGLRGGDLAVHSKTPFFQAYTITSDRMPTKISTSTKIAHGKTRS